MRCRDTVTGSVVNIPEERVRASAGQYVPIEEKPAEPAAPRKRGRPRKE